MRDNFLVNVLKNIVIKLGAPQWIDPMTWPPGASPGHFFDIDLPNKNDPISKLRQIWARPTRQHQLQEIKKKWNDHVSNKIIDPVMGGLTHRLNQQPES
jgi:hypothetical protein